MGVLLGLLAAGRPMASTPPPVMKAVRVVGAVHWLPVGRPAADPARWIVLEAGTLLHTGDQVWTGPDGRAELRLLGEAGRLWVEPGTRLQVGGGYESTRRAVQDPELARAGTGGIAAGITRPAALAGLPPFDVAYLALGRLWVQVVSGVSRLWRPEVATPTAVAGVRGTLFRLEVLPDGQSRLYVAEGRVELRGREGRLEASRGERAEVRPSRPPTRVPGWTQDREAQEEGDYPFGDEFDERADVLRELAGGSEPERFEAMLELWNALRDRVRQDQELREELLVKARESTDGRRSGLLGWLEELERESGSTGPGDGGEETGDAPQAPPGGSTGPGGAGGGAGQGDDDGTGGGQGGSGQDGSTGAGPGGGGAIPPPAGSR